MRSNRLIIYVCIGRCIKCLTCLLCVNSRSGYVCCWHREGISIKLHMYRLSKRIVECPFLEYPTILCCLRQSNGLTILYVCVRRCTYCSRVICYICLCRNRKLRLNCQRNWNNLRSNCYTIRIISRCYQICVIRTCFVISERNSNCCIQIRSV